MRNHQRNPGLRAAAVAGAFGLALTTSACPPPQPAVTPGLPAPPGTVVLTDANVASIFITANQAEVQRGQLALQRSRDTEVREFAQRMVTDHGAALQQAEAVLQRRGIMPAPGTVTPQLQQTGNEAARRLGEMMGTDFDRAYIDYEVENHRWLLQSIDNMLMPATRDRELDALLAATRPTVVSHLEQAQRIQARLRQMPAAQPHHQQHHRNRND